MVQGRRDAYPVTDGALALQNSQAREQLHPEPARREKPRALPQAAPQKKQRIGLLTAVCTVLFFAAVFTLLYRQIDIQRQIVQLDKLRTELRNENARTEDLNLELALRVDIEQVRTVAQNEMSMRFPDTDQTYVVSLPPIKTNTTAVMAQSDAPPDEDEQRVSLLDWLRKISGSLGE